MKHLALLSLLLVLTSSRSFAAVAPVRPDRTLVDGAAMVDEWVPPVYPADALAEKIGGRVVTRLIVDATGAVTSARVLQAADPRLGEAALAAVKL